VPERKAALEVFLGDLALAANAPFLRVKVPELLYFDLVGRGKKGMLEKRNPPRKFLAPFRTHSPSDYQIHGENNWVNSTTAFWVNRKKRVPPSV